MKKLLVLVTLLPYLAFAQDAEQNNEPSHPKNEIGISTGIAPSFLNSYGNLQSGTELWLTTRLTYLHNINNIQVGLIVEGAELEWSDGSIVAAAVLNRKFPIGKSYIYTGGSAGFYYSDNISKWPWYDRNERGYALGMQAGLSLHLSNRFSFISEVGVRSTQVWFNEVYYVQPEIYSHGTVEGYFIEYIDNRFFITVPMTMGIRYRF